VLLPGGASAENEPLASGNNAPIIKSAMVLGAILAPASLRTRQIGSTPGVGRVVGRVGLEPTTQGL
jgi:hypothetical protein